MSKRLQRTSLSFLAVVAAYAAYALLVVPWVEPSVALAPSSPAIAMPPREQPFAHLFAPGSWELERPKILETEQGTLLFDEYRPLDDQRTIELNRCTFIRFLAVSKPLSASPSSRTKAIRGRPILVRAPAGAVLIFDRPLNITQGEFGNLVGGRLRKEVVIESPATDPQVDDALRVTSENVQIDARRIWTPHAVRFQYGPNTGYGRDLTIEWSREPIVTGNEGESGSALAHIQSLELVHLDKLQLRLKDFGLLPNPAMRPARSPAAAGNPPRGEAASEDRDASVDVVCRGPVRFEFPQQIVSLTDQVRVIRHNAQGPSDELECELLEIHVGRDVDTQYTARPARRTASATAAQPRKFVAVGNPVKIRVSSRGAEAVAERIEYDFFQRRLRMHDKKSIHLADPRYRMESKEFEYELGVAGRLGRFWAQGPGHVWGKDSRRGQDFEATWQGQARLSPLDDNLLFSLIGDTHAAAATLGSFAADEMHVFLWERPRPDCPDQCDVTLDRLKAVGNVQVESPRFRGIVREAKLWFRQAGMAQRNTGPQGTVAAGAAKAQPSLTSSQGTSSMGKLDLVADLLQAQVVLDDPAQLERLTLKGGIRFQQRSPLDEQILLMTGDLFELQDGNTGRAWGALLGQQASLALRGMQLKGSEFRLRQAENTLEIVGPGAMTLPPRSDARGPLPPLFVEWAGGMRFDGRVAHFQQRVSTRGASPLQNGDVLQVLGSGESLKAALTQRLDFANPGLHKTTDVGDLAFDADVFLESHLFGPSGAKKLFQQMQARNLTINRITGQLNADGPGAVSAVYQAADTPAATSRTALPTALSGGLQYLRVRFARQLVGNLQQGEVEFLDRIKSIYGPVTSWDQSLDESQPQGLGEESIVLTCDRLAIADMAPAEGRLKALELEATGNAVVTGRLFTATGQRISYVRVKDQLVLEGDGRNDATLTFQPQPGGAPLEVKQRKIIFWPSTRQFEMNDVHSLNLRDLRPFGVPGEMPRTAPTP